MKQLKLLRWVFFIFDTLIFWSLVFIIHIFTSTDLPFLFHLSCYLLLMISLYSFRAYDLSRLAEMYDSSLICLEGIWVGGIVSAAVYGPSSTELSGYSIMVLFFLLMLILPSFRSILWKVVQKHFPVIPVIVIGEKDQWQNLFSEFSSLFANKILVVDYCKPTFRSLYQLIFDHPEVSTVIIADSKFLTRSLVRRRLNFLRDKGIRIEFLPLLAEEYLRKIPIEVAKEFSNYYEVSLNLAYQKPVQRIMDLILALVGLVVFSPLGAVVSVLIILEMGFPVIFSQERTGLKGIPFKVHKFRTMRNESKDRSPAFANQDSYRITPLGKILRNTHIDELPQLWNVIVGDMSLIGPRPEQVPFVKDFSDKIPFYHYRHCFRPGITGWAQINYPYATNLEESRDKLEYDLYYIKNHSSILDLKIILKTMETVLNLRQARSRRSKSTEGLAVQKDSVLASSSLDVKG